MSAGVGPHHADVGDTDAVGELIERLPELRLLLAEAKREVQRQEALVFEIETAIATIERIAAREPK